MSLIGFIYLVVIIGWIFVVLLLKCKKSITPHTSLSDNYINTLRRTDQRRPASVHVIQLQRDDVEREDHLMESYHCQSHTLCQHSQRLSRSAVNGRQRSFDNTYPIDAIINPAYNHDEDFDEHLHEPPPSYDEVMRQPDIYPKVQQFGKSLEVHI